MPRAVSSALGVLLLTALTLVLAAVAGVAVIATVPDAAGSSSVTGPVALSASATVDAEERAVRVVLVHDGGPDLDVRELEVRISVGGTRLERQPSVPFYSASGYGSFPSGPFNPVADPRWEHGERAGLVITGENASPIVPGATVRVELYRDDLPIAAVETTAT